MYNTANLYKPTKEDVYNIIPEYDIYRTYLGYAPIVGKVYTSPFRPDSNPSFGIFKSRRSNKLLFKDFGNGESGDAIKFAKLMEGLSTQETIDYLYKHYKRIKPKITKAIPEIKAGKKEIYANKIPWTKEGLNYWQQFGITKQTLNYFKVFEVDKFYIDGRLGGWKTSGKPIFVFEIYDKDKIYRPNNKQRFLTNCTTEYIQGWEQLDYSKDTVIITKSMKDVMYLYQLGYTAVAPNGEGHKIVQKALKILKENFKYIIVLYDFDKAGICGTKKILKENKEFGFMFTSDKYAKDISDYHLLHGKHKTKELLSKKIDYVKNHHYRFCTNEDT